LIGGGPGAVLAMRRHVKTAFKELGLHRPLVAYVGAASGDSLMFQKMIASLLVTAGARVKAAKLVSPRAKVAAAKDLLASCDLVFVSGGDVREGMTVLEERGVVSFFRELAHDKKPMMGISAGSLMLAKEWVHFPDDDDTKATLFDCIGAAPIHVDAHSEDDGWSELKTLVALRHRRGDADPCGYGLMAKGCLRVHITNDRPKLSAMGTPIPRIGVKHGKIGEVGSVRIS
jgi:peptidase E